MYSPTCVKKESISESELVSGDADFVPAAKVARREGIDFVLDHYKQQQCGPTSQPIGTYHQEVITCPINRIFLKIIGKLQVLSTILT